MANPFVHIELNTTNTAKAKEFYGQLFGWKLSDMPMGDMTYTMIDVGGGTGGGITRQNMPNAPSGWVPYVQVDNLKASTEKARSLGAKILMENEPAGEMGTLSVFQDPTGAVIGLWQPKGR